MKTNYWRRFGLTMALAGAIFSFGCANNQAEKQTSESSTTNSPVPPPIVAGQEPAQKVPPTPIALSPGVDEIVKLAQANVEESVILSYVDGSPAAYDPSADEIVYLKDIGISSKVVSAMIRHGKLVRERQPQSMSGTPVETPAAFNTNTSVVVQESQTQTVTTNYQPDLNAPPPTSVYATTPAEGNPPPNAVATTAPEQVVYTAPTEPVTMNNFQQSLSPYGTWMQVPDYGWVWQPSVVTINSNWQPYCDGGRWVYTDCGWYWLSDYSWGWAPFHYGRWYRHASHGWLWTPDTVWGPSWVCWRRTPVYCGWAPLPPSAVYHHGRGFSYYGVSVGSDCDFGISVSFFSFMPYRYFCAPNPRQHFVGGAHAGNIYRDSTVVNHYYMGPNRTVINEGIERDKVASFSRTEIRKINVRDMPPAAGRSLKPDRLERDGSSLVIYRPNPQTLTPQNAGASVRNNQALGRGQQELRASSAPVSPRLEPSTLTGRAERPMAAAPPSGRLADTAPTAASPSRMESRMQVLTSPKNTPDRPSYATTFRENSARTTATVPSPATSAERPAQSAYPASRKPASTRPVTLSTPASRSAYQSAPTAPTANSYGTRSIVERPAFSSPAGNSAPRTSANPMPTASSPSRTVAQPSVTPAPTRTPSYSPRSGSSYSSPQTQPMNRSFASPERGSAPATSYAPRQSSPTLNNPVPARTPNNYSAPTPSSVMPQTRSSAPTVNNSWQPSYRQEPARSYVPATVSSPMSQPAVRSPSFSAPSYSPAPAARSMPSSSPSMGSSPGRAVQSTPSIRAQPSAPTRSEPPRAAPSSSGRDPKRDSK